MELTGKHITLGVTGGIAAYKSAELLRLLIKEGATVQVVMTDSATRFVTPLTFQALSGRPVFTDQWDASIDNGMPHIELSRQADLVLVAPATANFLAKLANGQADDLLSTLALAKECPLLAAPAMNRQMWTNPATQRNIDVLNQDGIGILGPGSGEQACGEVGQGRMLEAAQILDHVISFFQPKLLGGKRMLITAGPTFEAIDPVRGITNLSSGKMGFAIARAAHEAGAEVTLVSGPVHLPTPLGIKRIDVTSAQDMHREVMAHIATNDIFVGVAAVADYRPEKTAAHKIKKTEREAPTIALTLNPDILAEVAALPNPPLCVGFAAETKNLAEYAQKKRHAKKIPLIVGNLIQDGFGGEDNTVTLYEENGAFPLPSASKLKLARTLMGHIARHLSKEA